MRIRVITIRYLFICGVFNELDTSPYIFERLCQREGITCGVTQVFKVTVPKGFVFVNVFSDRANFRAIFNVIMIM